MKPLDKSKRKHVLSGRSPAKALMSFGREMKPHEENVIRRIPGNDIHLAEKAEFGKVPYMRKLLKVHHKKLLVYWYPLREYHFSGTRVLSTDEVPEKNVDASFLTRKAVSVGNYARKYFFGKK